MPGRIRQIHYHKKLTPPVCPNNYCITVTCNVHIQEIKEEGQLVQLSCIGAFPFHSLAIPWAQRSHYSNILCPYRASTARWEVRVPRREVCLLPPPPPPPPLPPPPRPTDYRVFMNHESTILRTDLSRPLNKLSALCVSDIPHFKHGHLRPAADGPLCLVAMKGERAVRGCSCMLCF